MQDECEMNSRLRDEFQLNMNERPKKHPGSWLAINGTRDLHVRSLNLSEAFFPCFRNDRLATMDSVELFLSWLVTPSKYVRVPSHLVDFQGFLLYIVSEFLCRLPNSIPHKNVPLGTLTEQNDIKILAGKAGIARFPVIRLDSRY